MSSRWIERGALAGLVLVAGCTALLSLDDVRVAADRDGDGVPDDHDNCPDAPNPAQLDFDANGIGDACDTCASPSGHDVDHDGIDDACDACLGDGVDQGDVGHDGIIDGCELCPQAIGKDLDHDGIDDGCDDCADGPPHDEDHDGLSDACDDCPALDGKQQEAADADRVGDACDPSSLDIDIPSLFDGFGFDDAALWQGSVGWMVARDQLIATTASDARRAATVDPGPRFHAELAAAIASADPAGRIAVTVSGPDPAVFHVTCTLTADGHVLLDGVGKNDTGAPTTVTGTLDAAPGRVVFALAARPCELGGFGGGCTGRTDGQSSIRCTVDPHGRVPGDVIRKLQTPSGPLAMTVTATRADGTVDYVWLLTE